MENVTQANLTTPLTSEKTIKISIKEGISILFFLISFGITIGGFYYATKDLEKLSVKADKISDEISVLRERDSGIKEKLSGIEETLKGVKENVAFVQNKCLVVSK